jgi:hypothetical protein
VGICGVKRDDISPPRLLRVHETAAAPGEAGATELYCEEIGRKAAMSAIAVGKWVDQDEAVMEPHGDLIRRECPMLHPVARIFYEQPHLRPYLVVRDANIAVGRTDRSGPSPHVA